MKPGCLFQIFIALVVLIVSSLATAYQPHSISTPTSGPAMSPVSPTPAGSTSNIPPGKFLFVEFWHTDDATSPTGLCPGAIMIDFPNYYFENGRLRIGQVVGWDKDLTTVKGFYGYLLSATGAAGGGTYSYLTLIKAFPYYSLQSGTTIDSVDAQGAVVVEIQGQTFSLAANQDWVHSEHNDATPECHRTSTTGFTNHGFLDKSQIVLN